MKKVVLQGTRTATHYQYHFTELLYTPHPLLEGTWRFGSHDLCFYVGLVHTHTHTHTKERREAGMGEYPHDCVMPPNPPVTPNFSHWSESLHTKPSPFSLRCEITSLRDRNGFTHFAPIQGNVPTFTSSSTNHL